MPTTPCLLLCYLILVDATSGCSYGIFCPRHSRDREIRLWTPSQYLQDHDKGNGSMDASQLRSNSPANRLCKSPRYCSRTLHGPFVSHQLPSVSSFLRARNNVWGPCILTQCSWQGRINICYSYLWIRVGYLHTRRTSYACLDLPLLNTKNIDGAI
ncbi:hypothetical protein CPC08DRAFT_350528 [Agrocybe pediades]|nr:hypothetical protein CPC08DRAFT_350528 [Agrocybe pediades]